MQLLVGLRDNFIVRVKDELGTRQPESEHPCHPRRHQRVTNKLDKDPRKTIDMENASGLWFRLGTHGQSSLTLE